MANYAPWARKHLIVPHFFCVCKAFQLRTHETVVTIVQRGTGQGGSQAGFLVQTWVYAARRRAETGTRAGPAKRRPPGGAGTRLEVLPSGAGKWFQACARPAVSVPDGGGGPPEAVPVGRPAYPRLPTGEGTGGAG